MGVMAHKEQLATCRHCKQLIALARPPTSAVYTGYRGYWYHRHNQHVLCGGAEASAADPNAPRATP